LAPAAASAEILLRSTWSGFAPLAEEPLLSVVLPTRNRPSLLPRAVESVRVQTYPHWELIVIDDGEPRDARLTIASIGDPRVRVVDSGGSGAGRARNVGVREASGAIVTFLDDDNLMAPGWLRAVTLAFQGRPELSAVYGAQLRASEAGPSEPPSLLYVAPFDWEKLLRGNYIDLGTVAHRSGLDGMSFDESLPRLEDWDYVVHLAANFGIEALPVMASVYMTDAPTRRTEPELDEAQADELTRRFHEAFGARDSPGRGVH
jgi:glycosyltransferase involved in cell wall biosynthesis